MVSPDLLEQLSRLGRTVVFLIRQAQLVASLRQSVAGTLFEQILNASVQRRDPQAARGLRRSDQYVEITIPVPEELTDEDSASEYRPASS